MRAGVSEEMIKTMSAREHRAPVALPVPGTPKMVLRGGPTSSAQALSQAVVSAVPPMTINGPMANDDILKMVKAGIGDDLIISVIQSHPGEYSTSPDDLVSLKQAGILDRVLGAMVAKATLAGSIGTVGSITGTQTLRTTPAPRFVATSNSNDSSSSRDAEAERMAPGNDLPLSTENNIPGSLTEIGVYYKKTGMWTDLPPEIVNFKTGGF
jgi:hypothetical protein